MIDHPACSRAGVIPGSEGFSSLLDKILKSPAVSLYGFYGHAGNSYASTSLPEASAFLSKEVQDVNLAAGFALEAISRLGKEAAGVTQPFVLSVGSTPTAHAASAEARNLLSQVLHGVLELHAGDFFPRNLNLLRVDTVCLGNYPLLDLQQQHTSLIDSAQISQHIRATVVSYYPGRGGNGGDEALVDAGAIAFSKDTGPSGIFGEVVGLPWTLSRISQEHGILISKETNPNPLKLGSTVSIIGQHACLIAAVRPITAEPQFPLLTASRHTLGTTSSIRTLKEVNKWSTSGFLGRDGKRRKDKV